MFRDNRKGQLFGPNIALIAATITVVIILIASFLLVKLVASPDKDTGAATLLQNQDITSLEAYLQTPINVSVDGKSQMMEMSDLIRLAKLDKTYRSQLETATTEILSKVYGKNFGIDVPGVMSLHNKVTITGTYYSSGSVSTTPDYSASATIVLPGDISVTLSLM